MLEAKTNQDLDEIKLKILRARAWALRHFNNAQANDTRFVDEVTMSPIVSAFVDFPSPDKMGVAQSFMGRQHYIVFSFRLHFKKDGRLVWEGENPLTNAEMKLEVPADFVYDAQSVVDPVVPVLLALEYAPEDTAAAIMLLGRYAKRTSKE